MTRTASIAGLTLAAAVLAAPTAGYAAADDPVRLLNLIPERPVAAPEPAAGRHVRPTESRTARKEKSAKGDNDKVSIPSGPQHIIVSIAKQRVTLYANGERVASTPASTGTPGHPTPIGVFAVIQKHRHHVSNLYNASMPYMQRITWSGSALHEGPLPGYPASHGCVRLSSGFAQLLWKATKIGARVIVTRDDVAPTEIDMPNPFVPKPKTVDVPALKTLIKTADATGMVPVTSGAGNSMAQAAPVVQQDSPGAMVTQPAANKSTPEQATKSGGERPMSGAASGVTAPAASAPAAAPAVAETAANEPAKTVAETVAKTVAKTVDKIETNNEAKTSSASEQATKSNGDTVETVTSAETPAKATDTVPAKTADRPATDTASAASQVPMLEPAPVSFEGMTPAQKPAAQKPVVDKPVVAEPAVEKPAAKPVFEERPVSSEPVPLPLRAPGLREAKRTNDPIAIFISRKEAKLYVRQKMEPLFDAPISFQRPDQPVGTHVFTAMAAKGDDGGMRWTVVSIPSSFKAGAPKKPDQGHKPRRSEQAHSAPEHTEAVPDARSAFERVVIPPETVERLSALFIPGSSIIVSDNKLSDETGEYTEFIVLTP